MGNSIRQVVASLDANLPLRELKTMEAQLDENVFAERILSRLTMQFSALATLLAAVGLYGVLSFNVTRRTREIGIRMALGSSSFGVRWLILREAAAMICGGALAGVALAMASGRYIESFLYLMKPFDALVYSGAVIVLAAVATVAAYLPAKRATIVDPMVALRLE